MEPFFRLPEVRGLLAELRWFLEEARPTNAIFRANHASNHLWGGLCLVGAVFFFFPKP